MNTAGHFARASPQLHQQQPPVLLGFGPANLTYHTSQRTSTETPAEVHSRVPLSSATAKTGSIQHAQVGALKSNKDGLPPKGLATAAQSSADSLDVLLQAAENAQHKDLTPHANNQQQQQHQQQQHQQQQHQLLHSPMSRGRSEHDVSEFIGKLYTLLQENPAPDVVRWDDTGDTFIVFDHAEFSKRILPNYFKHNNFSSFVRQLNKYDFRKLKGDPRFAGREAWLFKHEHFLRDNRSPLSLIRRKAAKTDMSPVLTGTPNASVMNLAVDVSSSFSGYVDAGPQQLLPTTIAADTVALGTGKTHSKGRTATASNAATPQALAVLAKKLQGTHLALVDVQQTNQRLEAEVNRLRSRIDGQEKMFSQMVTAVLNVEREICKQRRGSINSEMSRDDHALSEPTMNLLRSYQEYQRNGVMAYDGSTTSSATDAGAPPQLQHSSKNAHDEPSSIRQSTHSSTAHVGIAPVDLNRRQSIQMSNIRMSAEFIANSPHPSAASTSVRTSSIPTVDGVADKPAVWLKPPRVLVVEDEDMCRQICNNMLDSIACVFDNADSGAEAVLKLQSMKYDMVLMDTDMPSLDGKTTARQIRNFDTSTPIVCMTSNSSGAEYAAYMVSGINDVLLKPFSRPGLLAMVERHCAPLVAHPPQNIDGHISQYHQQQHRQALASQLRPTAASSSPSLATNNVFTAPNQHRMRESASQPPSDYLTGDAFLPAYHPASTRNSTTADDFAAMAASGARRMSMAVFPASIAVTATGRTGGALLALAVDE